MWIDILRKEVEKKGPRQVAKEIGYSRSTVDLALAGKYPGNVKKVKEKVMGIYGHNGQVPCEFLGTISPARCVDNWNKAKKIGMKAGNPETLRLYKKCLNCSLRRN